MPTRSLLAVEPDDDALGNLRGGEGRPAGGRRPQHLAGRDLPQREVVRRSAVLVHVRASVPSFRYRSISDKLCSIHYVVKDEGIFNGSSLKYPLSMM